MSARRQAQPPTRRQASTDDSQVLPEYIDREFDPIVEGSMPDRVAEMYNFLDGDSFGIGPMHEFVYGWQSIVNVMSTKNNIEVRKRAGLQRFTLAGINGVSLITHNGVTEIMMNGTRTYCFGGVHRPPGFRSAICRGAMYQEARFDCRTPYLRFATPNGYYHCISEFAVVKALNGTIEQPDLRTAKCIHGEAIPYFHHTYICNRRELQVRHVNLSDSNERANIQNPVVRRAEFYRSPLDILRLCPDWYGCDLQLWKDTMHQEMPTGLLNANETAFIGHGGKYWLALYYSKLSDWAIYFQTHTDYVWQNKKPPNAQGGLFNALLRANIGRDMNLHYNTNGIYNRFPAGSPDLLKNDEVLPWGIRHDEHDTEPKLGAFGAEELEDFVDGGAHNYLHNVDVKPSFEGLLNVKK